MKKIYFVFILFFAFSLSHFGQTFKCQWAVSLPDMLNEIIALQDSKGNIWVCNGNFLTKLNSNGKVLSQFSFPEDVSIKGGGCDTFNNLYVTGTFQNELPFKDYRLSSNGGSDIFLTKINPLGEISWCKQAGGIGNDEAGGLVLHKNSELYIVGTFRENPSFGDSNTLKKINTNNRCRPYVAGYNVDGSFKSIKYWDTESTVGDPSFGDMKCISPFIDIKGNFYLLWIINRLNIKLSETYSVADYPHPGIYSYQLLRMDSSNSYKSFYFGTDSDKIGVSNFTVDSSLNTYVIKGGWSQYSGSGSSILLLDPSFKLSKEIGPPFLSKPLQCVHSENMLNDIIPNNSMQLSISGSAKCWGTVSNENEYVLNCFVEEIDTSGKILERKFYKPIDAENTTSLYTFNDKYSNSFYTIGYCEGGCRFENSTVNKGYFISKFVDSKFFTNSMYGDYLFEANSIYPNPSNGFFVLKSDFYPMEVQVRNIMGQTIGEYSINNETQTIDLTGHPKGIYFIEASNLKTTRISKVILD